MSLRDDLLTIVRAGIRAADAGTLLVRELDAGGVPEGPLRVVCAGKASVVMAATAAARLGAQIRTGLVVSGTPAAVALPFELVVGGHPTPTTGSERAGRRALAIARATTDDETLLVLISGGASALMAAPADSLTLEDKCATTRRLLRAGADICALNTVRKHVSSIKGGRLAVAARGRCLCYAISDVVDDDPSVIGSGPTVPDPSTFDDALEVLRRFGGPSAYPGSVVTVLTRGATGEIEETPKPGDSRLEGTTMKIIGNRSDAMAGAAGAASERGYTVVNVEEPVVGEARIAALHHFERVAALARTAPHPLCVISAGETVVTVTGHGRGGRNQEFALASAEILGTGFGDDTLHGGSPIVLAAIGTDGVDGPTDAAGALADQTTVARAASAGLGHPRQFLDDNNAYAFFAALGDLIHTGPTATNVGDLQIVLVP